MEASTPRTTNELPGPTHVGIRELRHDFRAWLSRVEAGEEVIVTDRGRPIAEFRAHRPGRSWLDRVREDGLVIGPAVYTRGVAYPVGAPTTKASDALREDRSGQRY